MEDDEGGLRQRSTAANRTSTGEEATGVPPSISNTTGSTTARNTIEATTDTTPMVGQFRRGPVLAYRSGGSIATTSQQRTNYKNKIILALGATILYTAFLYRSGKKIFM
jgi:hypothetical protein